jgi:16S rRNA (cytidine1402-2'-O)-methyltransferase
VIFFEAPHRMEQSLTEAKQYLGNRLLCLGRELTKLHQEFIRGTAGELAVRLKELRGEFTVVVSPTGDIQAPPQELPELEGLTREFRQLTESDGFSRREAIAQLARKYDRSSREVYARLEAAKNSHS